MKKTTIILILSFLICQIGQSQSYRTALGLRLGTGAGPALSVQQKIAKYSTIEGIFQPGFNNKISALDLIYERHHKILFKRFNIYMGAGLHKSWFPNTDAYLDEADAGFVGIIGGEITFKKINVSWDYKPSANVIGGNSNYAHQSAISLRVVLIPQKKRKINWKFWKKKKSKKEQRRDKRDSKKNKTEKKERNWKFWEK